MAQQAELARVLQRQRRDLQEKEFGALVEAGMNPYEVFRRRDQEAAAARQHEAITSNIATRQLEVAAQLAREQEAYAQKLAARKREKKTRVRLGICPVCEHGRAVVDKDGVELRVTRAPAPV